MPQKVVRFGSFEVDLDRNELRKDGALVRLQEQPFRILTALLEDPGEVVAREELVRRLWPEGTYVDFDRGLNAAVTRLRQALTDSAENPRYVETVARRGYRFSGSVQASSPAAQEVEPSSSGAQAAPAVMQALPGPRSRRSWRIALVTAAALLTISIAGWLAVTSSRGSSAVAGSAVPLTTDPGNERCASLSPDGSQVVFESDRDDGISHLFVKVVGPGDPLRLTSGSTSDYGPAWSPDGRSIAFVHVLNAVTVGVFVIPALGGAEHKVAEFGVATPGRGDHRWLDWTRDSKDLIISAAEHPGEPVSLFVLSADGSGRRRLTVSSDLYSSDFSPAVSPDGHTVAFTRGVSGMGYTVSDIYLLDLDGERRPVGRPRRISSGRHFESPAWTPDGKALIVSGYAGATTPNLFRMDIKEDKQAIAVPFGEGGRWPALRSTRLVYSRGSSDPNIWRQRIPSGHEKTLPPVRLISSTVLDGSAQYSPDGTRIAFESTRSGYPEIWTCGSDGEKCTKLTSFNGPLTGSPRWSPDGRQIAFDSSASGEFNVYLVDSNGGLPARLGGQVETGSIPKWSHDGKWIYFTNGRGGRFEIWKMESGGGKALQVTRGGGYTAVESPDGKSLFYTNSPSGETLWKSGVDGSNPVKILEGVSHRGLVVTENGIYYLHDEEPRGWTLRLYLFRTAASSTIAAGDKPLFTGLGISPDNKYLLYAQVDQDGSDLMTVEKFL